ncbi:peptidyl-prolyl cis-trans isomerase CYP59 isoform X2 [Macadamia integrifolia]|nr:peptidyl-prolyl cis-trans isomerase CYP59 isoform X2 [Macadamia integrifolia]
MASAGENLNASQFYFTLRGDLDYLDGKHTVFGEIAEGLDTLTRINEAFLDDKGRPYKNIRIKHTYILDDPFDDPPQLAELIPDASPEGKPHDEIDDDVRLEDDWVPMDDQMDPAELEEVLRAKEAHSSAVVLESIGDIPEAEIKPPDNVLFVCKLNPVTEDEDLHTIFSRFGNVISAEIIRDFKTKDSLCYAFVEFETKEACEQAFFKMDNALIDDRRIHVDFSQSVAKLWFQYRRKENQMGKGKSCFKCGAVDHISKDCTGEHGTMQPPKYTLKDENTQRGGTDNARYDMVFDGDAPSNSEQLKLQQELKPEDQRYRDREKKDRHWHDDRNRQYREDEKKRDSKESRDFGRKDEEYHRDRSDREKQRDRNSYKGHESRGDRRDDQDYRKKSADGDDHRERNGLRDGRDDLDHTERSANRDGRGDWRDDRDYGKRSSDRDDHEKRNNQRDSKDDRDHTKRSANRDGRGDRKDDRDYRKRSADGDDHGERNDQRDSKYDRDHTKSTNRDGRGDRRDEHDYKKRNISRDGHGERRDEQESKRHRDDRR